MEHFLYYLLRASVVMILFYGFYKLFFGKTTFHRINRFLLFCIAVMATVLPFFQFKLIPEIRTKPAVENLPIDFSTFPVAETSAHLGSQVSIPWIELFSLVFVAGFLFSLLRYLIGVWQLMDIIRKSQKLRHIDDTVLCVTDKAISPFSWMNYIVLPAKDVSADNRAIIHHERAHIHLNHSFDMVFFNLFTSVFWFNPFSWLLRREIQAVHEYQADEQVLNDGIDIQQYQLLLIRKSVGEYSFALANNFRQRDLHKRMTMMKRSKTNNRMKWIYTVTLPVLLMAMGVLSVPKLNARIVEKATDNGVIVSPPDTIIIVSSGKMEDIKVTGFKAKTVTEPSISIVGNKLGAEPLFIVDGKETETMSGINPEQIESITVLKGNHATETYGERAKEGVVIIATKEKEKIALRHNPENKPLIILDGEIQGENFDLNSISSDKIESVSVLKDQSAVERYGDQGKDGVVLIITKENSKKEAIVIDTLNAQIELIK